VFKRFIFLFKKKLLWKTFNFFVLYEIYRLFDQLKQYPYVLIKKSPIFPLINIGSDFDIFVKDLDKFSNAISEHYNSKKKFRTTTVEVKQNHIQVDLFYKNKFLYKFDLYGSMYESNLYNKTFINAVLETKISESFNFFRLNQIYIPSKEMDVLIRLFELYQFPHKKHHRSILMSYKDHDLKEIFNNLNIHAKIDLSSLIDEIYKEKNNLK